MVLMSIAQAWPPPGHLFTADDLDRMPDDGRRYEILDGVLIVSPRPVVMHQEVAAELLGQLRAACPHNLRVIPEVAIQITETTEFDPDIVVIRREQLRHKKLTQPPLLVVEVRSPSTASFDLTRKKEAYAEFGVPSYWIVNPDLHQPELTVFELGPAGYEEAGRVGGAGTFPVIKPFAVEISPARLIEGALPQ